MFSKIRYVPIFLLLFSFLLIGASCPPTPPNPPIPPEPPIEYEWRYVCIDSGKLQHIYCPEDRVEHKKYVKGSPDIPTGWCDFHVKPPDPPIPPEPLPPKYETYSINWIGLLPWMVMKEMEGVDVSAPIDTLIEKSRRSGAAYIHSFCWVGDPVTPDNQYHQFATPWLWIDGKIDFTKKNPEYERQFKALAQVCKKYDMEFRPIFFMSRYNYFAFRPEWNVNGISDFYSLDAGNIQKSFISDCVRWLKDVFGPDYKPTVLLINEPAHYGVDALAHIIADWHMEMGDYVLQWTTPDRLWVDGSHSEYAHAYFVEPHECPKCGQMMGRAEYASRLVRSETHGCSTLEGFQKNQFDDWIGSGWTHGEFSEDGSDSGSKLCDGISAYRQANVEELDVSLRYTLQESYDSGKAMYFILFDFCPIKAGREDYSNPGSFCWDRIGLFPVVYMEIYGNPQTSR